MGIAALTRNGLEPVIVAPDVTQAHVVNHTKGEEMSEERNVLLGKAREANSSEIGMHNSFYPQFQNLPVSPEELPSPSLS